MITRPDFPVGKEVRCLLVTRTVSPSLLCRRGGEVVSALVLLRGSGRSVRGVYGRLLVLRRRKMMARRRGGSADWRGWCWMSGGSCGLLIRRRGLMRMILCGLASRRRAGGGLDVVRRLRVFVCLSEVVAVFLRRGGGSIGAFVSRNC